MKTVYKKLVGFQDAVDMALSEIRADLGTEKIDISSAEGRILSRAVFAPRNNPPFNRATMDGYAVRSENIRNASPDSPVELEISGESFIGEAHKYLVGDGNCFRISTGAIVPVGSDSVVKVESTEEFNDRARIFESTSPSDNIAEFGSDVVAGEMLIAAGKEIETNDIAVLASLGIHSIEVFRKLKINVISTGNELISYREENREGQINDANGVVLTSELNSYGCIEASYSGIVKDQYDSISSRINEMLESNDIVILSGGSSAGESDLVYRIIEEFDPGLRFHGVLVKPGLPTVLGKKGSKTVIGLPGFPVSALMIFRSIFFVPILRAARSSRVPEKIRGKLGTTLRLEMGKQNLVPVSVSDRTIANVYPVTGLSGSISRFTSTAGFLSLPGNSKFLEASSDVDVILWGSKNRRKDTVFSGIFLNFSGNVFREDRTDFEFHRMLPRDSLQSLSNGDSDFSVFYCDKGFDVKKYVLEETGKDDLEVFIGPNLELNMTHSTTKTETTGTYESGKANELYAGPSLRLLRNIVGGGSELRKAIGFLQERLPDYFPGNLGVADGSGVKKSAGTESIPLTAATLVFVVPKDSSQVFEEFVHTHMLKKI